MAPSGELRGKGRCGVFAGKQEGWLSPTKRASAAKIN